MVRAGTTAQFQIALDRVALCSVHLPGSRVESLEASRFDQATVEVTPPPATRAGSYRVTMTCSGLAPQQLVLRVRQPHSRNHHVRARLYPWRLVVLGTHMRPLSAEEAWATAKQRWAQEAPSILAGYANGQCTDWAAQKRPDVIEKVYEASVVADLLHQPPPPQLGDAQTWATVAADVGMSVSDTPAAGALVVWQEGVEGANAATGHVGYVESVSADGSTFSTSEMNDGGPYVMGYRTLATALVAGRSFILP
jgi:surface antigen